MIKEIHSFEKYEDFINELARHVQCCYDINEIYALFVKPEAAQQGYELALLVKAIELNMPNQMMVVVDVDDKSEIDLYIAAGFVRLEGQNSITAYIR